MESILFNLRNDDPYIAQWLYTGSFFMPFFTIGNFTGISYFIKVLTETSYFPGNNKYYGGTQK